MKHKAPQEPKPCKAFRDKYLAACMMVVALLISLVASAQTDSVKYSQINGYGFKYKRLAFDSVLMVPLSTSPHVPYRKGGIRYNPTDSTLQLWTGYQWRSIVTGGTGIDTAYVVGDSLLVIETPNEDFFLNIRGQNISNTSLTANGDYTQNWNHHWFFLNNIKVLDLNSYRSDDNHPGNKKRFRFFSDSTIDGNVAQWMWGMKNISEDFTDSLHFELTSTKDLTYLYQHTFGGGKSIEMDWDPHAYYPSTKIYANGNSKNGYYELGASVATIQPNDSVVITGVPSTIDTTNIKPVGIGPFGKIYKLPGWPGSGSGSSISLTNVGSGYRLVTTPNGSIKSIIPGDGQLIDSASTTITVKRDTTGANGTVTRSEIKDTSNRIRAICQWPAERQVGVMYEKSSWVNTNDFTVAGTAATTLNGSFIDLSGGNGTYGNNYIRLLTPTNLSKWKMTAVIKLTSTLASGSATAFGLHYANTVNPFDLSGNFAWTSGSSPIYVATTQGGGTVYQTSAGNISVSTNDIVKIECEFKDSAFTVTATNLTTGALATTTTYTWATPSAAAGKIPNTCYFSIYAIDGTQQIQSLKIESNETKYASVAFIGNSKEQVGFADHWYQLPGNLLNAAGYHTTITRAGEGDGVNNLLDGIDEIRTLAPRVALLSIGSNSYRAGFSTAQIISSYDSLTTAIEAIGTQVYHIVMPEDSVDAPGVAVGMTFLKEYIAAKYGSKYISGVWDTLATGNRLKSAFDYGDGVHLNQAGINAVVAKIIQSGKITVCNERIADDQFARAQIAGSTITSTNNTGNYINNSSTLQPAAQFNIGGPAQSYTWVTTPASSPSNAAFSLTNISASASDAPAVLRPTGGGNKSMELYIVPSGVGAGGNVTGLNLFNSDYIGDPSNFGYLALQMKATEFDLHSGIIGSAALVPIKVFTGSNTQLVLNTDGTNSLTGNTHFNNYVSIDQMDSTGSPANIVWRDPNTHKLMLAAVPSGGDGNGVYTGSGSLSGATTITGAGNTLALTGTQSSAAAFNVSNTGNGEAISAVTSGTGAALSTANSGSGTGATISSNSGHAVNATSTSGTLFRGTVTPSSTNTDVVTFRTIRQTTGTAAANMSQTWSQDLEDDAGNNVSAVQHRSLWTSAVGGSTSADYQLWTVGSGTLAQRFTIKPTGQQQYNQYGANTFSVTPATTPVYSSNGTVGERIAPKIYTATISATAGNNPTVTVLGTNEIGAIVWTRNSSGNYSGTLTGAFTTGKTWLSIQRGSGTTGFVNGWIFHTSANVINIQTQDNAANAVDSFDEISFEIRVYP